MVCIIFPNQESNLCILHRQADSLPLRQQGSPKSQIFKKKKKKKKKLVIPKEMLQVEDLT